MDSRPARQRRPRPRSGFSRVAATKGRPWQSSIVVPRQKRRAADPDPTSCSEACPGRPGPQTPLRCRFFHQTSHARTCPGAPLRSGDKRGARLLSNGFVRAPPSAHRQRSQKPVFKRPYTFAEIRALRPSRRAAQVGVQDQRQRERHTQRRPTPQLHQVRRACEQNSPTHRGAAAAPHAAPPLRKETARLPRGAPTGPATSHRRFPVDRSNGSRLRAPCRINVA